MKKIILSISILLSGIAFSQEDQTVCKITTIEQLRCLNKYVGDLQTSFNGKDHVDSVLILLNEYRKEYNLKPIVLSESLCDVAAIQAQYCADNLICTHENTNIGSESLTDRAIQFKEYNVIGEIALQTSFMSNFATNETCCVHPIEMFKYSPGHANIMKNSKNKRCGISLIQSQKDTKKYFVVIVFSNK